ncbi:alpha/beta fold hydrolase [Sphingomonas arenae]|uniref:alpha/beta fold hydrolase n=1 Tax=Sphingomonas arenae TaxID=2812555 RepID=UPI00234FE4C0|nr:alpha/beta fold hydrolase [Sphingomonas arenae]
MADILGSLRLTGGVILEGSARGRWCVSSQMQPEDVAALFPGNGPIIAYHYIHKGRVFAQVDGMPAVEAGEGSVLMLPRNDQHMLFTERRDRPIDSHDFLNGMTERGLAKFEIDGEGEEVAFFCGFLGVDGPSHPLLDCLPPLLVVEDSGEAADEWLHSNLKFLTGDRQAPDVIARVAELLFAQSIRAYLEHVEPGEGGWLAGLRDSAVAKALATIHSRYAEELDVELLAREAGVSRTVLGERFAATLGESPMRYCAKWRMRRAANLLRDGKENTANIAYAVGFNSEAAFNRAFKREYGLPPVAWKKRVEAERRERRARPGLPEQVVRYCHARDGTRLAYSSMGEGPPLVKTANWLNHIDHDWDSPLWRHWLVELARDHCLLRYDERGNGMSDWDTPELSLDAFVEDLRAVVDCQGLDRFDLLAISQGAAVAVAFATRYPDRVRRLVICNGYAAGWKVRAAPEEVERREAMMTLTRTGWGSDDPIFRQLFTSHYIPEANQRQTDWFNDMQRLSASPENAVRLQQVLGSLDVRELLTQVRTPTLIFHSRHDKAVPFSQGEELAAGIAGSRFVPLESHNHILLDSEPAWPLFVRETRSFLAEPEPAPANPEGNRLTEALKSERRATCKSKDGTRLALSLLGEGPALIVPGIWFHHVGPDTESPLWKHWIASALACGRTLIRADVRGGGESDPSPLTFEFERLVEDLAAQVAYAGEQEVDLLAFSNSAPMALAFAARRPERVRKLVLVGGYAQGVLARGDPDEIAARATIVTMGRQMLERDPIGFGRVLGSLVVPDCDEQVMRWCAARMGHPVFLNEEAQRCYGLIDVTEDLERVRAPVLLIHSRGDRVSPYAGVERIADALPNATLRALDSQNHILTVSDPCWPQARAALHEFLRD